MKTIQELIEWYEQNATRKDDNLIQANLKLIDALYGDIEYAEDKIYFDRIIDAFCEIMQIQREVIQTLTGEMEQSAFCAAPNQSNIVAAPISAATLNNDKELQAAFTDYCLQNGKSSYTANDYCSRIKNLWRTFYQEYQSGGLPDELEIRKEKIQSDSPLLNAYHHVDELHCYISMKVSGTDGNRNWLNVRAAFNKFDEFKNEN